MLVSQLLFRRCVQRTGCISAVVHHGATRPVSDASSNASHAAASPALQQWLLDTQSTLHELEMSSVQHVASSSSAVSPHDANSQLQRRITVAESATNSIETLLQSACSPVTRAASSILLSGLDLKAIVPNGSLSSLRMEGKEMSRVDFTGMSFVDTVATACDFSRSVMLRVAFYQSQFRDCRFDGAILKSNSIVPPGATDNTGRSQGHHHQRRSSPPSPVFVNCSFKYCMVDVVDLGLSTHEGTAVPRCDWLSHGFPIFENCDFMMSDVKCSASCAWMFRGCRNVPAFTIVGDRAARP